MTRIATALVTGASSGLGMEFARQLAARRCGLVLVARRKDRLDGLAEELGAEHGVRVEVLAADLAQDAGVAAVEERLSDPDRPVDLLVNNAGTGSGGSLVEVPVAEQQHQLRLNVEAVVRLSRAALAAMGGRGHGAIVNVASMAGTLPGLAGTAVYSASKAFVRTYTEGLAAEAKPAGVRVTAVLPGFVRTDMTEFLQRQNPPEFVWSRPETVVAAALRALATGRATVVPGAQYRAGAALAGMLPRGLVRAVGQRFVKL